MAKKQTSLLGNKRLTASLDPFAMGNVNVEENEGQPSDDWVYNLINAQTPDMSPMAQMKPSKVSVSGTKTAARAGDDFSNLAEIVRQMPEIQEQQAGIQELEALRDQAGKMQVSESDAWVKPLLALADSQTGSKLLSGFTPGLSEKDRNQVLLDYAQKLQDKRSTLTKDVLSGVDKMKMDKYMKAMSASAGSGKLSPFEEARQKDAAKRYNEYYDKVRPQLESNAMKVENAMSLMYQDETISGPKVGYLPGPLRKLVNENAAIVERDMQSAIQETLRPTLGAQFTEAEGVRIMNLAFDPKLSAKENKRRAAELKGFIDRKMQFQDALNEYLSANNGSDQGFPYAQYGMRKSSSSIGATDPKIPAPQGAGSDDAAAKRQKRIAELKAKQGRG